MSDSPATPVVDKNVGKQDPSPLATEQVIRAVANLQALFEAKLAGEIRNIETRINGMDKALGLVQNYPTEVDKAVKQLKDQHEAKFASLENILRERKEFDISQKVDVKNAVEAAFNAAKDVSREQREASERVITKSEQSIREQLTQLSATTNANNRLFESGIADLKERMTAAENRAKGALALWGYIIGVFGLISIVFALVKGLS